jgi:hypothetical protein
VIPVTSTHVATLTVPMSGNPDEAVKIAVAPDGRSVSFQTQGASPADARQKLRDFLQATSDAAQAP